MDSLSGLTCVFHLDLEDVELVNFKAFEGDNTWFSSYKPIRSNLVILI